MRDRWERFCREYPADTDPAQAAIRAGYAPQRAAQTAARLLRKEEIRRRIGAPMPDIRTGEGRCVAEAGQSRRVEDIGQCPHIADETEVMRTMTRILRGEMEAPVKASEACRAAELLARRYGLLAGRTQSEEEVSVEDARAKLLAGLLRLRDA